MVYVFKTSVKKEKTVNLLTPELNKLLPQVKWNFDLEDCDKILRVETSTQQNIQLIVNFLNEKGFSCEELTN